MHLISCAVSIAILFGIKSCSCDVLVYTQATNQVCESFVITATTVKVSGVWNNKKSFQIIEEFQSLAARFGPSLPPNGFRVLAVGAEPADGCSSMNEAPKANFTFRGISPKFVAVIIRGTCSFAGSYRLQRQTNWFDNKPFSFCR